MRADLEGLDDLLPALRDSAGADPRAPTEVYRRLKFLARVLGGAGDASGASELQLLWLDERGEVRSLPVRDAAVVIGRDPACDVVLAGSRVSRRHCMVRVVAGSASEVNDASDPRCAEIEDLGSSNGTVVNGRVVQSQALHEGDVIEAGGATLALVIGRGLKK